MANFKLATLFVEFVTKNAEGLQAATSKVTQGLGQVKTAASGVVSELSGTIVATTAAGFSKLQGVLNNLSESFQKAQESMQRIGNVTALAYTAASVSLLGFVRAGLQGTAMGDQLSFRMGELSRTVAGLFAPEIQKVTGWVQKISEYFRSLSAAQKENLVHWIQGVGAALLVATVLPKVVAGVTALSKSIAGLAKEFVTANLLTGNFVPLLAAVATAFAAFVVGTEVGRNGLSRLAAVFQPVLDVFSQFGELVMEALEPLGDIALEAFASLADSARSTLGEVLPALAGSLIGAVHTLEPAVQALSAGFRKAFAAMGDAVKSVLPALQSGLQSVAGAYANVLPLLGDLAAKFAESLGPFLAKFATQLVDLVQLINDAAQQLKPLGSQLLEMGQTIGKTLLPYLEQLQAKVQETVDALRALLPWFMDLGHSMADAFRDGVSAVESMIAAVKPLDDQLHKIIDTVKELSSNLLDSDKMASGLGRLLGIDVNSELALQARLRPQIERARKQQEEEAKKRQRPPPGFVGPPKPPKEKDDRKDPRGPLFQGLGGFEAIDASYARIAQQSRLVGAGSSEKTESEKQTDLLERISVSSEKTAQQLSTLKPPVMAR